VSALPLRDRAALAELSAQRFLSRRQLEELLLAESTLAAGSRATVVKRILRRLRERGLVQVSPRLFEGLDGIPGETAYSLTPVGRRVVGSGLAEQRGRGAVRGNFLLAHALMVAEIGLCFRRCARGKADESVLTWESDWQVAEGRSGWAALPDARLVYAIEGRQLHAFIEADRGTEGARFFAGKIARYLDLYHSGAWCGGLPVWPLVLTVTLTEPRARELWRASEGVLGARAENAALARTFRFAALAELRGEAGPFGAIWRVAGTDSVRRLRDGVARNDGTTDPPCAA